MDCFTTAGPREILETSVPSWLKPRTQFTFFIGYTSAKPMYNPFAIYASSKTLVMRLCNWLRVCFTLTERVQELQDRVDELEDAQCFQYKRLFEARHRLTDAETQLGALWHGRFLAEATPKAITASYPPVPPLTLVTPFGTYVPPAHKAAPPHPAAKSSSHLFDGPKAKPLPPLSASPKAKAAHIVQPNPQAESEDPWLNY